MKIIKHINAELVIWCAALLFLALWHFEPGGHFTICPLKNMGFSFCPGCGLGLSIHYLFNMQLNNSFHAHPLGLFALMVLLHRIFILSKTTIINFRGNQNEQPATATSQS